MRDATILRSRRPNLLPMLLLSVAVGGCASSSGAAPGGMREVLTHEEISSSSATTAYDAVRLLRPSFLRGRGARSMNAAGGSGPVLYVDGIYRGDAREMEQIPAATVLEIRYLDSTDATMRFGTGHTDGAILVTTRTE